MSDDIFDVMRADDGYRVDMVAIGDHVLALHVGMYQKGMLTNFITDTGQPVCGADAAPEIIKWVEPTFVEQGQCNRLYYLMDAVLRYLNTGGTWEQFDMVVSRMRDFAFGPLTFPGYTFRASEVTSLGDWEHAFLANNADARHNDDLPEMVVWCEGSFISRCTIKQYEQRKRMSSDEEEDYDDDPGEE